MLHPTLKCPKHGFAFVSMPRWDVTTADVELEMWEFKCPIKECDQGVLRERDFDIQPERDFESLEEAWGELGPTKEDSSLE